MTAPSMFFRSGGRLKNFLSDMNVVLAFIGVICYEEGIRQEEGAMHKKYHQIVGTMVAGMVVAVAGCERRQGPPVPTTPYTVRDPMNLMPVVTSSRSLDQTGKDYWGGTVVQDAAVAAGLILVAEKLDRIADSLERQEKVLLEINNKLAKMSADKQDERGVSTLSVPVASERHR